MILLLEFHRSPNCAKVRVALNYKGIPFEMEEMSANDRTPMRETANWPLVPVIVDRQVRMRDSEAILHYLESNYRQAPSLTPAEIEEVRRGEGLRDEVQPRLRPILRGLFGQALKPPAEQDGSWIKGVGPKLEEALKPLEQRLGERSYLTGDEMSIYDIILACPLAVTRAPAEYAAQSPVWAFLREQVSLPKSLPHIGAWMDRVLAYDPPAITAAS
jgi:glutathione S-transferase